ncbi:MAG: hypothetical protein HRU19_14885 [Pseudobacteriovorax sp.]|nr:hypothetical protein [Pseudobacteriovorax sp.]
MLNSRLLGMQLTAGVGLSLLAYSFLDLKSYLASLIGYILFSINLMILTWLSGVAVAQVSGNKGFIMPRKSLIFFLAGLKFVGLVAVLYLSLVYYSLPATYFAFGALVSLGVYLFLYMTEYLKKLGAVKADT